MGGVVTAISIIAALFAVLLVIVGAIVITRSGILEKTNTMLDTALRQTRAELAASEERCNATIAELEARHDVDMAGLRGRIDSMTPVFAQDIANSLARLGKRVADD